MQTALQFLAALAMTTITMLDQQRTDPLLEKVELLRGRGQRPAQQPKQNDRTPFPRTTRTLPVGPPITHTAISIRSEDGNGGKTGNRRWTQMGMVPADARRLAQMGGWHSSLW